MSISSVSSTNTIADALFSAMSDQQTQLTALAQTALSTGADRAMNGDYEGATREFRRSIGLDSSPQNAVTAYHLLATSYIQMGRTEDAIKAYQSSIRMAPTDDTAHLNLGNIYFSQGRYNEAEAEYRSAVRNNPTSSTNLFSLGQVYLATDRNQLAETTFKRVIQMDGSQYGGYYALGQTYAKAGRQEDAISEFQKVISLKKDFYQVHVDLGYAYADLGQTSKAKDELSILNDKAPNLASVLSGYLDQIAKPKILAAYNVSGFANTLGPGTKVSTMDKSLTMPGASHEFNMVFMFTKDMDLSSITNPFNWSIAKAAYGAAGGPYNWGLPTPATDVNISPVPIRVTYAPDARSATVSFLIKQNASANGTIDPSHIRFKFNGKDVYGNTMDTSADEYSGISKIV
ncbi:MAG TPA: tetratricopeptide repeat protein [Nitrospirota bacterium]|nr:tetratricopeptide repeat protein [Nitrospirota bacterium]